MRVILFQLKLCLFVFIYDMIEINDILYFGISNFLISFKIYNSFFDLQYTTHAELGSRFFGDFQG